MPAKAKAAVPRADSLKLDKLDKFEEKTKDVFRHPAPNTFHVVRLRGDDSEVDSEKFAPPLRMHPDDAAYDLTASRHVIVAPRTKALVSHNFAMALPQGYYGLILPRSGALHLKGLIVHPGTIDNGYRGEIMTLVYNPDMGRTIHINPGERISQLLIMRRHEFEPKVSKTLPDGAEGEKGRGEAGFGSTGGFVMGKPGEF